VRECLREREWGEGEGEGVGGERSGGCADVGVCISLCRILCAQVPRLVCDTDLCVCCVVHYSGAFKQQDSEEFQTALLASLAETLTDRAAGSNVIDSLFGVQFSEAYV
jgi:hypothetical protein